MSYNYEKNIWGRGAAGLKWSDPASVRLRRALKFLRALPPGSKIIEVGCGAGQFIRALKYQRPDLECFGCDISAEALQQAKKAAVLPVIFNLNEENSLPYAHDSFDAVLVFDVLEHVRDPKNICREIYRVMKKNGQGFFYVPCEGSWLSLWHWLRKFKIKGDLTKEFAGHINYFSLSGLFQLLRENNFTIRKKSYSEHFFGQWLGFFAFFMMERQAVGSPRGNLNNESYFSAVNKKYSDYIWFKIIRKIVNSLVFMESRIFSFLPSPNVFLTVKKI